MNIIITGASRGIGYETAKILSKEHKVIAISRSAEENKLSGVIPIAFDFEKGNIKTDLLPKILSSLSSGISPSPPRSAITLREGESERKSPFEGGKGDVRMRQGEATVDVLINNAATFIKKSFEQITSEEFEKVFRINVFSIAELTRAILPLIPPPSPRGEGSGVRRHVLNIASMGAIQGSVKFPGLSAYSSSKGALLTLTECLAEEYKGKNISFNAIAFGAVQTEMLAEAFPRFKAPITAKEAAKFVADFAINGQKYFNGKILQMALSTP